MTTSEVDAINPEATNDDSPLELSTGIAVDVNRLKTRETMKLLKILTRGAGYALGQLNLGSDTEEFAESLVLSIVFAIPEAENETIDFVRAMVAPSELIDSPKSKAEKEINAKLLETLDTTLENPELEDLVTIITRIIQTEAPHIQALGKRLGLLMKAYRPEQS